MLLFKQSSSSPEESANILKQKIAPQLILSDKVLVIGALGAGKTFIIKKLLAIYGITNATSPTFNLVHYYEVAQGIMLHLDLYRLNHFSEVVDLGLEQEFNKKQLMLIEWGDKFPELLTWATKKIMLEITGERKRKITFEQIR